MGLPAGRELRNLHCGLAGKPTFFATCLLWHPVLARLSGGRLPFVASDALLTRRRSGLPGWAAGGFSIRQQG